MGRTKNNTVAAGENTGREPILDPLAEGIVTDEFVVEEAEEKEGE